MTTSVHTYRVTVRGQFDALTDEARRTLAAMQADHDVFKSGFTREGTFTYDSKLDFFNLRYEVRIGDGVPADADPSQVALDEAERFLRTLRIGHKRLKAAVMDMSAMTDRAQRNRA